MTDRNSPHPRPRLSPDEAESTDLFPGSAHERLAKSLADIILHEGGGRAIGLEGPWGSGKSTVIEIARKELEKSENSQKRSRVFLFDAWAHQGDPMRRSFLEELISYLADPEMDCLRIEEWRSDIDRLQARLRRTTESEIPNLSRAGKVLAVALVLLPLAYLWLSPFLFGVISTTKFETTIPYFDVTLNPLWLGTLAAAIVPAVAFLVLLVSWWRSRRPENGSAKTDPFNLLFYKTEKKVTDQLIRDEEPTTIEFNSIFDRVIRAATNKSNKIVIVIDNLDRLPPETLRNIWATMRNFFASNPQSQRGSVLRNVWLIVPFDRDHIESVFREYDDGKRGAAIHGFIEKTFEIILRVAPPLLSNWQQYLYLQLEQVFGPHLSETERHRVFKVLDFNIAASPDPVTPRRIKTFANTVGILASQWRDRIPMEFLAAYALYREQIASDETLLRSGTVLDTRTNRYFLGTAWQEYFAAVHFNVDPSQASEILLVPAIEDAITSEQEKKLKELSKKEAFGNVLASIIDEKASNWAQEEPNTFLACCYTIDSIGNSNSIDAVTLNALWEQLVRSATYSLHRPDIKVSSASAGIASLVSHAGKSNFGALAQRLRLILRNPHTNNDKPDEHGEIAERWAIFIDAIASAFANNSHLSGKEKEKANANFKGLFLSVTPDHVLRVAAACTEMKVIGFDDFRVYKDIDLQGAIISRLADQKILGWLQDAASTIADSKLELDWEPLINNIEQRLQSNSPALDLTSIFALLEILRIIRLVDTTAHASRIDEVLDALAQQNVLWALMQQARSNGRVDVVSFLLFRLLLQNKGKAPQPPPQDHPHYGPVNEALVFYNSSISEKQEMDDKMVASLAEAASKWEYVDELIDVLSKESSDILTRTLERLIDDSKFEYLVIDGVIDNWDRLSDILTIKTKENFLRLLDSWSNQLTSRINEKAKLISISEMFFRETLEQKTEIGRILSNAVSSYLKSMDSSTWKDELVGNSPVVRKLMSMNEFDRGIGLGESFREGLVGYAQWLVGNNGSLSELIKECGQTFPEMLPSQLRTDFYEDLLTRVISAGAPTTKLVELVSVYGAGLVSTGAVEKHPDIVCRRLLGPIIGNRNSHGLLWIQQHSAVFGKVAQLASDESRESLRATIQEEVVIGHSESEAILHLGEEFGFTISPTGLPQDQ